MRDVCDVSYALLLDQLERQTLADRQIAALQAVMSGEGGELPSIAEQREAFDTALAAEPSPVAYIDPDQLALRQALGVA